MTLATIAGNASSAPFHRPTPTFVTFFPSHHRGCAVECVSNGNRSVRTRHGSKVVSGTDRTDMLPGVRIAVSEKIHISAAMSVVSFAPRSIARFKK